MDDLLSEFLTETGESIEIVDSEVVRLEQDPNNKEVLDNIFRLVHTIKGTCGFLGLPRLEGVAHAAENVLGKFRDGEIEVTPDSVTVILESLDRIKEILGGLEADEEEPAGDDRPLVARLDAIITGADAPKAEPKVEAAAEPAKAEADEAPMPEKELRPGEVSLAELEAAFASAPGPEDEAGDAGDEPVAGDSAGNDLYGRCGGEEKVVKAAQILAEHVSSDTVLARFFVAEFGPVAEGLFSALLTEDVDSAETIAKTGVVSGGLHDLQFDAFVYHVKAAFEEVGLDDDVRDEATMLFEHVRAAMIAKSAECKAESARTSGKAGDGTKKKPDGGASNQSIRVNVDLLEDLMNMVSELVLTRNQLMQMVRKVDDSEFGVPLQRLSQCTTELQESVMKTRMQPIGNAWAKLPRIVRDLNLELGKKVELDMVGAETELDRQVLELIKDPLTHMVRNSADHGVETPAVRLANGKTENGTIRLSAYHEGGHIIIEIADDGAGLPVAKLKAKAIENGMVTAAEADQMSDNQIQRFIFGAGFSTAKEVTSVSGRGVGMDVVRTNIEKIGGTVDLTSTEGKGTTFKIKIPLTLAIVSALIVEASGQRYAIPQLSVLELVSTSANSEHTIERIKDTPVLRLRDTLLPLVFLSKVLAIGEAEEVGAEESQDLGEDQFIVVAQVGAFNFGIVVDQVFDTEEIVVKPVAPILKQLPVYSGNTILGDGSVIMILDPNGVAAMASQGAGDIESDNDDRGSTATVGDDVEAMLLFRGGNQTQKAVPLALIARLEDLGADKIEETDGKVVVQYRGALMPLVGVSGVKDIGKNERGRQLVLVFTDRGRSMGLAVDEILDIVEARLDVELSSTTPGVIGSGIISEHATEVVDVAYYLGLAFNEPVQPPDFKTCAAPVPGTEVLLVDDSSFFRNMIKPLLTAAGYKVTTAVNGEEALSLREDGSKFDLIISDIEMPVMDGFAFAEAVKTDGLWKETPIVALSNKTSEESFQRGREVGFSDYVAKMDRDALLQTLSQQLKMKGEAA